MEKTTLGHKIKTLREAKELTQEQLARDSGLTKDHISKLERDEITNIRTKSLSGIAHALGIKPGELLDA